MSSQRICKQYSCGANTTREVETRAMHDAPQQQTEMQNVLRTLLHADELMLSFYP
jgi:hypothetical protein